MNLQIEAWTGKLLYHLISDIAGMTKELMQSRLGELGLQSIDVGGAGGSLIR